MIVVADTSPLNYLIWIDAAELLPSLYGEIRITPACVAELLAPETPEKVRTWISNRRTWLTTAEPIRNRVDRRLSKLDKGEREAIALALELKADLILMDERLGRSVAQSCGLAVAGTLRVLADAASLNLIDLAEAFGRLRQTSFRVDPQLLNQLLRDQMKSTTPTPNGN